MERESLKEINEELRCSQAQQHQLSQAGTSQKNNYYNKDTGPLLLSNKDGTRYLKYRILSFDT